MKLTIENQSAWLRQRGPKKKGPLRKIVRTELEEVPTKGPGKVHVLVEVLECGHRQRPRFDFIGPTNAVRRRCAKCAKGG